MATMKESLPSARGLDRASRLVDCVRPAIEAARDDFA